MPIFLLFIGKNTFAQGSSPAISPKDRENAIRVIKNNLEIVSQEKAKVFSTNDKYVRFMMAPSGNNFFVNPSFRNSPQRAANWFLSNWSGLFVNYSPRNNFRVIRNKTDKFNNHFVRYQQYYNGLEVIGSQINCMVNASGGVVAVLSDVMRNSESLDSGKVFLNPKVSQLSAQNIAIEYMSKNYTDIQFQATKAELKILDPKLVDLKGEIKLVWQTIVSEKSGFLIEEKFYIDASNGEILEHNSLISYAVPNRAILHSSHTDYYKEEPVDPQKEYLPSPENHPDLVTKVWGNMWDVQNFYYEIDPEGREGWNDDGTTILKVVLIPNISASWGNGYIAIGHNYDDVNDVYYNMGGDDVIGHEFTHGVFDAEGVSDTPVQEAICNMFGEWIDQSNQSGIDIEEVKWLLHEDTRGFTGNEIDMKNPHKHNYPEIYLEPYYWGLIPKIHAKAGVGNKLCYLITDGDTFNGYTINGLGIPKASSLFYYCVKYWSIGCSDYIDLGNILQISAYALGFSEQERYEVEKACRAVNIYSEIAFEIQDSSGVRTSFIDDNGNMYISGKSRESYRYNLENEPEIDELFIYDYVNERNSVVLEADTGDLYTYEHIYQGPRDMNDANGFIINNSKGTVAYIEPDGDIYLNGYIMKKENINE